VYDNDLLRQTDRRTDSVCDSDLLIKDKHTDSVYDNDLLRQTDRQTDSVCDSDLLMKDRQTYIQYV